MEYVQLSPEFEAAVQVQQEVTAAIEAEERDLQQMRMEDEQEDSPRNKCIHNLQQSNWQGLCPANSIVAIR